MNTENKKRGRIKSGKGGHANGGGTLEKRGHIWLARWVVDGKRFTKSTGTGDKREAERVLAELVAPTQAKTDKERLENLQARITGREAEIKRFEDRQPALAVADAFEAYCREPNIRAKKTSDVTLSGYESEYGRFTSWLEAHYPEAVELRNVSYGIAKEFTTYLAGVVSANTYNKHITLFKRMWKVLDEAARLDGANPWTRFDNFTEDESVRRELTQAELVKIGQNVEGEMARLFAIGIYSGLRLGDAVTLDWDAVDFVKNHITVMPRKTKRYLKGKPVHIPLVAPFRRLLLAVPTDERTGPLCPKMAEMYERNTALVSRHIQRVFEKSGIETQAEGGNSGISRVVVGFHSLRHTFVTMAAENNIPLSVVQAVVGHTSPAMTRHYLHIHDETLQANFRTFPDVFAAGDEGAPVVMLEDPTNAPIEAEGEVVATGATVGLDAETLAKVDAVRREGESRADAIRRAVELLANA